MNNLATNICNYFQTDVKKFGKSFSILLIISIIYFFPFLISDVPYFDDYSHINSGSYHWSEGGRPLNDFLMAIVNFDFRFLLGITKSVSLINISPLLQILAIVAYLSCSILFAHNLLRRELNFYYQLLIFTILANPFYLQIIGYQYESFTSSLSLGLALLAAINTEKKILSLTIGSILLIISLLTYQLSVNVFLGATFLILIINFKDSLKESLSAFLLNIVKLLLAIACYKLLIFLTVKNFNYYYSHHKDLYIFDQFFLINVLESFNKYNQALSHALSQSKLLIFFVTLSIFSFAIKYLFLSKNNPLKALFVFSFGLWGLIISIYGCLCFMKVGFDQPQGYIAFSLFSFFVIYSFLNSLGEKFPFSRLLIIFPLFYCLYLSYGYSSVMRSQKEFNYTQALSIKIELENLGIKPEDKITFSGHVNNAPSVNNSFQRNNFLQFISANNAIYDWFAPLYFTNLGLQAHYDQFSESHAEIEANGCKSKAISTSSSFKIAQFQNYYIVAFKDGDCFKTLK